MEKQLNVKNVKVIKFFCKNLGLVKHDVVFFGEKLPKDTDQQFMLIP